jgi:hypothetical protein
MKDLHEYNLCYVIIELLLFLYYYYCYYIEFVFFVVVVNIYKEFICFLDNIIIIQYT